jgi:hypothetical protein
MEPWNIDDYISDYNVDIQNSTYNEIYDSLCRVEEEQEVFDKISASSEMDATTKSEAPILEQMRELQCQLQELEKAMEGPRRQLEQLQQKTMIILQEQELSQKQLGTISSEPTVLATSHSAHGEGQLQQDKQTIPVEAMSAVGESSRANTLRVSESNKPVMGQIHVQELWGLEGDMFCGQNPDHLKTIDNKLSTLGEGESFESPILQELESFCQKNFKTTSPEQIANSPLKDLELISVSVPLSPLSEMDMNQSQNQDLFPHMLQSPSTSSFIIKQNEEQYLHEPVIKSQAFQVTQEHIPTEMPLQNSEINWGFINQNIDSNLFSKIENENFNILDYFIPEENADLLSPMTLDRTEHMHNMTLERTENMDSISSPLQQQGATTTCDMLYTCPHCQLEFYSRSSMLSHMRVHHNMSGVHCQLCNLKTGDASYKMKHEKQHRTFLETPYFKIPEFKNVHCPRCPRGANRFFDSQVELIKHIKTEHENVSKFPKCNNCKMKQYPLVCGWNFCEKCGFERIGCKKCRRPLTQRCFTFDKIVCNACHQKNKIKNQVGGSDKYSAFDKQLQTYKIESDDKNRYDLLAFLASIEGELIMKIRKELLLSSIKYYCSLEVAFIRFNAENEEIRSSASFKTTVHSLVGDEEAIDLSTCFQEFQEFLDNYLREGSGWSLDKISHLTLHTAKYKIITGSGYFPLPDCLKKKKVL